MGEKKGKKCNGRGDLLRQLFLDIIEELVCCYEEVEREIILPALRYVLVCCRSLLYVCNIGLDDIFG